MAVNLKEDILLWPKDALVPISIPFDKNLSGRTITFYGVRASDKTSKVDLSGGIVGGAANTTYTPGLDIQTLVSNKLYRLIAYTDADGNGNRWTVIPNPLTDNPVYFIPQDPDGL